ncbi:DUF7504 family protein [Halobacterium yunchengense]|uniref:DUF7504 family protein n=1 Tax=Halobacterium yunchengense TaxID=3108497 RepID=UPI0030095029
MSDVSHERGWVDDPETFTDALADLERDGCVLLVLESADDDASHAGCRRLLGDDPAVDRRRLFVSTDGTGQGHPGVRATDRASGDRRVVGYRTAARGAVAAAGTGDPDVPTTTVRGDLETLAATVESEVDALAPRDGYDAGQLRVCVDALGELLAADDLLSVLEFTKSLRAAVTDADGIAHVHVGTHVPGIAVEGVLSQFDAVVEVAGDDDPRQRWHLPDESLSTRWLEL